MKKIILAGVILLNMMGISYADESPQIPHLMNLQTLIYDSDGNLSSSETVDLTIRILDENQHVIYSESQPGIPIVNGAVNVSVGSNQPLTPDLLDPSSGGKFLDIAVGAENPFETMPLVAVPYSLWAEKALTVPDESIESRHIKNGTIKIEDLEPLAFSQLTGQATDTQIPSTIARGTDLSSHIGSTSAHPAAAITVSGHFVTVVAQNVQEFLEKVDGKLAEEIANRRSAQGDSTTQVTNLQNTLNTHINGSNTSAHTFGNIAGQIGDSQIPATLTRDSELATERTERQAADSGLQSTINSHTGADIATAHTGTFPASRISGALSTENISDGSITSTKIADNSISSGDILDGTITAADIFQSESDPNSLDTRYVNEGGDAMSGPLYVLDPGTSATPPHPPGTFDVGGTLRDHERRIGALEGATPREVARGSLDLRTLMHTSIGRPPVYTFIPYYIPIAETCTDPVGHSGPVPPIPFVLGKYFTNFSFSDSDQHPRQDLAMITDTEMHLFHRDDRPCIEIRIKCSFSGEPYFTDTEGSTPILQYTVYQLVTE